MRLRVHDDGRWAVQRDENPAIWDGPRGSNPRVHSPGWHEAIVLTPTDADAQRLAEAISEVNAAALKLADAVAHTGERPAIKPQVLPETQRGQELFARAVLDRLAAGNGGQE